MDYEKILRALLSKAFKLDAGQIDELTKDADAETKIFDLDKNRVAELTKPKTGQTFQDGYKKGKAESLTELETKVKEKFGVETDVTGLDLIDAVIEEKTKTAGKPKEITDDDVRKHAAFINADKAAKAKLKEVTDDFTGKLATKEAEFNRTQTLTQVQQKAWAVVEGLKPVLPQNAKVAQTIKDTFLQSLSKYDYQVNDDGTYTILNKDGKVVDDGHGHNLGFDDLVKSASDSYFEFSNNNGGGNGGNNNKDHQQNQAPAYPAGVVKPKTLEEYAKLMDDDKIKLEDRQTIANVWDTEHGAIQ